ncbi:MAG: CDP-alcohol phosphatidyltransferase family protein [Rhodothalassiaceae bacterium]
MAAAGGKALATIRKAAGLLPNLLGIGRILAAPLVAWLLLRGHLAEAFWVFLLAGLSDAIDGELARRLGVVSRFGAVLDPAADKILIGSGYAAAATVGLLPWWLAWLVIGRDVAILLIAGITWLLRPGLLMLPLRIGKISTGTQIAGAGAVLAAAAYAWPPLDMRNGILAIATVMTILSGLAYALNWIRTLRRRSLRPRDPPPA